MGKNKKKKLKNTAADEASVKESQNDAASMVDVEEGLKREARAAEETPMTAASDDVPTEFAAPENVEAAHAEEKPTRKSKKKSKDAATPTVDASEIPEETVSEMEAAIEAAPVTGEDGETRFLVTDRTQIEQVLEAIIFAAPKAMSLIRLRNLMNHFNYDSAQIVAILDDMIEGTRNKGFQLVKVAGGYQFRSHPEHSEVLQKLLEDRPARLSASALEVLAIIAYKQPVTRGDIDSVRGVDSGHLLKGLLEKDLVRSLGHAETAGRPLLYGTTAYFLEVFTLGSLDDLPQMDELKRELAPSDTGTESSIMADIDHALGLDSSGLAANPDRGSFDEIKEEEVESPDFGLQERAAEELA